MGGGKGGTKTEVRTEKVRDSASERKLAEVAEQQQKMAKEQWDMYKEYFMPYEIEAATANREILPLITESSKTTLGLQAPVTKEFYRQSLEGVDVGERVQQAGTEVIHATKLGEGIRRREMSRYGIDPSSETYADLANEAALSTARGVAGARTAARTQAEAENYSRLGYSLGRGVYQTQVGSGADPYARAAGSFAGSAQSYSSLANRVLGTKGTTEQQTRKTEAGVWGDVLGIGAGIGMGYLTSGASIGGK
jgi:hypothetical protein